MQNESTILELPVDFGNGPKDIVFKFKKLKPSKSLKFLMFMGKLIGGSAGKVIGSFDGQVNKVEDLLNIKEDDLNFEKLGNALLGVFDRIEDDDVIAKLDLLLGSVTMNGEPLNIDHAVFEADLALLPKIAMKALAVNYKRFLGGSSELFSKIAQTIKIVKDGKSSQTET
jgi:hypothetical protein